jgi:hypothetical protein
MRIIPQVSARLQTAFRGRSPASRRGTCPRPGRASPGHRRHAVRSERSEGPSPLRGIHPSLTTNPVRVLPIPLAQPRRQEPCGAGGRRLRAAPPHPPGCDRDCAQFSRGPSRRDPGPDPSRAREAKTNNVREPHLQLGSGGRLFELRGKRHRRRGPLTSATTAAIVWVLGWSSPHGDSVLPRTTGSFEFGGPLLKKLDEKLIVPLPLAWRRAGAPWTDVTVPRGGLEPIS